MNIILWIQSTDSPFIIPALNILAQNYGKINFLGAVYNTLPPLTPLKIGDVLIPTLNKFDLMSIDYDLIIIGGQGNENFSIFEEAENFKINSYKLVQDRIICMSGFTIERYRKLCHSKLSIFSMNNFGNLIQLSLNFPFVVSNMNFSVTDEEFLKFLHAPQNYINPQIHSQINWYNLLVVMFTENPKILAEFDELPYFKKICFVPFENNFDSGFYIKPYYMNGIPFNDFIRSNSVIKVAESFDIWDILLYGKKTPIKIKSGFDQSVGDNIKPGRYHYESENKKINYYNWSPEQDINVPKQQLGRGLFWLGNFIEDNHISGKEFNFFGTYGDYRFVKLSPIKNKIFFTMEEVFNWPWYDGYQDYCLDYVDLALGFEPFKKDNYIRFPYWLTIYFDTKLDHRAIKNVIKKINVARNKKKYECVNISSHDSMNTRTPIYNGLKDILNIKCAGRWNHNTDELKNEYNDDKMKYINEFMFNICPENVNRFGYVTEKIFDSFAAGSIPIYYGSDNNPEEGIINKNAVLFWNMNGDNEGLIKEIIRLKTNEKYYNKFMKQEKLFTKNAVEYVYTTFEKLAKKLKEMGD